MKHIIYGMIFVICLVLTIFSITNVQNKTNRKQEIEQVLTHSLENAIKDCNVNSIKELSDEELTAKLLFSVASEVSSGTDLNIKILSIDAEKGLLDVQLSGIYKTSKNKTETISVRKTALIEGYPLSAEKNTYTVIFKKNNEIVKKYTMTSGQKLIFPDAITNWKYAYGGNTTIDYNLVIGSDAFLAHILNKEMVITN